MPDDNRFAHTVLARSLEEPENDSTLPKPGSEYQASGAPSRDCVRLTLIRNKEGFKSGSTAYIALQYVHLGIGEFAYTGEGQKFTFFYSDYQPKLLTVEGRNISRIFDYITLHRMPWIRLVDRDLRAIDDVSQEPVITGLRLDDWVPDR